MNATVPQERGAGRTPEFFRAERRRRCKSEHHTDDGAVLQGSPCGDVVHPAGVVRSTPCDGTARMRGKEMRGGECRRLYRGNSLFDAVMSGLAAAQLASATGKTPARQTGTPVAINATGVWYANISLNRISKRIFGSGFFLD